jgi:hypothetical protein
MLLSSRDDPHGAVRQGPAPRRRDAPHGSDGCASPILRPTKKSLTLASPVGTLPAMGAVIRTGAAVRPARATRRDLLLEILALRHQLSVLARSERRFRSADRLFWLFLRWLWPRWREALVLIQPGTVERWHRRRRTSMLAPSFAKSRKTTHRFTVSRSDSAPGR